MKYKVSFEYTHDYIDIGTENLCFNYSIITDVLLLTHEYMFIYDLTKTYIHEWELKRIKNLKIEVI